MNKAKMLLICLWVSASLMGCDDKPVESVVKNNWFAFAKVGDVNSYWIQTYSTLSNTAGDWTDNGATLVSKVLVRYNVQSVDDKGLIYQATTDYLEVNSNGQIVPVNPDLQTLFAEGLTYQLSPASNQVLAVSPKNVNLQQKVLSDKDTRREYLYLKSTLITPYLPVQSIPLQEGEKLELRSLLKMDNLSIRLDKVMGNQVALLLTGTSSGNNRLYGKAVLEKDTGLVLRVALVREVMVEGFPGYKMRTFLLMGPPEWSNHPDYQLSALANVTDSNARYQELQALPDFDIEEWQAALDKELTTTSEQGKIYTLMPSNAHSKLLLSYQNTTGTDASFLGDYSLKEVELFDKENQPLNLSLLPFYGFDYKRVRKIDDEVFVTSYRPLMGDFGQLNKIQTLKAKLSFTPYVLEPLILPIDATQPQKIETEGFVADISPTNNPNTFVLHWHSKKTMVFDEQLIDVNEKTMFQYLQPDSIDWLLPAESQAISWLVDGSEHYMKLTFKEVPKELKLYPLRKTQQPAFTHKVTFSRGESSE